MDIPDVGSVLELHDAIQNGRLDDSPLHDKSWLFETNELGSRYEQWRRCDSVIEHFKTNQSTKQREKAYLHATLCTGRALCPQATELWASCIKQWKSESPQKCIYVKRMVERCVRAEGTELLRAMDPIKFSK
ncbi:hypothetical protein AC1031_012594 [Aphanomyces cochlioides]|nr:hypothetical protein AC1031_012594 [Aphanomyces cochlioides]